MNITEIVNNAIAEVVWDMVLNDFKNHKGRPGKIGGSMPRKSMPSIEDYKNPKKNYVLPDIPKNILDKLGKIQKPVVLKKNIIEKNKNHHKEIDVKEYNSILDKGIYNANIVLKTNANDEYFNFIHYGNNKHEHVLIELSETKNQYEIVNFHWLRDETLKGKLNKAIKRIDNEGGQFLIDIESEYLKGWRPFQS